MQKHQEATGPDHRDARRQRRKLGSLRPMSQTMSVQLFPPPSCVPFPYAPSEGVLVRGEVCVLRVPSAWGQALFSVEVLRVYPNVQDLGVSARLSESGGAEGGGHFISNRQNKNQSSDHC